MNKEISKLFNKIEENNDRIKKEKNKKNRKTYIQKYERENRKYMREIKKICKSKMKELKEKMDAITYMRNNGKLGKKKYIEYMNRYEYEFKIYNGILNDKIWMENNNLYTWGIMRGVKRKVRIFPNNKNVNAYIMEKGNIKKCNIINGKSRSDKIDINLIEKQDYMIIGKTSISKTTVKSREYRNAIFQYLYTHIYNLNDIERQKKHLLHILNPKFLIKLNREVYKEIGIKLNIDKTITKNEILWLLKNYIENLNENTTKYILYKKLYHIIEKYLIEDYSINIHEKKGRLPKYLKPIRHREDNEITPKYPINPKRRRKKYTKPTLEEYKEMMEKGEIKVIDATKPKKVNPHGYAENRIMNKKEYNEKDNSHVGEYGRYYHR